MSGRPKVFSRKCSSCVFHPGNRMRLKEGRLAEVLRHNLRAGTALICHTTTYGQQAEEVVCRGYYDAYGESVNVIRVMNRLGGFDEVDPHEQEQ